MTLFLVGQVNELHKYRWEVIGNFDSEGKTKRRRRKRPRRGMPSSSQNNDAPDCRCAAHPCDPPARHSVFCPVYKMAHAEQHMYEMAELLARKLAEKHPIRAVLYRMRIRIIRWRFR